MAQTSCVILMRGDRERLATIISDAVWRWQQRFAEEGIDGLLRDKTRPPGKAGVSQRFLA
jgi:hypothetical protein